MAKVLQEAKGAAQYVAGSREIEHMKKLIGRKRALFDAQLASLRAEFEAEEEGIRKKIEEIEEDERERLEPKTEMTVIQQTGKKGRK